MKLRIPLYRLARRDAPRSGVIKYWTHAAGAAAMLFVVPSACAFYFRQLGLEDHEPNWVRAAECIWLAHGATILLAAVLWLIEKPRLARFVSTEADLVAWPEDDEDESDPPPRR